MKPTLALVLALLAALVALPASAETAASKAPAAPAAAPAVVASPAASGSICPVDSAPASSFATPACGRTGPPATAVPDWSATARTQFHGFCPCGCSYVPDCNTSADCFGGATCFKAPSCC